MARSQLSTEIVIDKAAEIADAEGLDALSLTRVANELGISQPALYRYVAGIDDLVRALGLRCRQVLADRLGSSAVGLSGEDAIRAMGNAWRSTVRDHPGLYTATDRYPCAGDTELEAAVDRIVFILGQGLASYALSTDKSVHAGRALRSAFHGFSHLEAGDGYPMGQDVDESFDGLLTLLCRGVEALAAEDSLEPAAAGRP
ncbi:MAG: TetR/AcrR family transcriptional regulator [Acidimicrobiia bacterium]|nr:TetR/AcrR family transcriptional regulator [Acidimicrobiia bacterium]